MRRDEIKAHREPTGGYAVREVVRPEGDGAVGPAQRKSLRPLTTQESYRKTRISAEAYERERANRASNADIARNRTTNREIIDARGSIDSRAFHELDELVGYSIDDADKPDPLVDSSDSKSRWRSHDGKFPDVNPKRRFHVNLRGSSNRRNNLTSLSDTISGKESYSTGGNAFSNIPLFVKIAVPVIVILLIVLLVILFL